MYARVCDVEQTTHAFLVTRVLEVTTQDQKRCQ